MRAAHARAHLILFETHRTVGKCRLRDAPQDEVEHAVVAAHLSAAIRFTLAEAAD
jgi:hypothetical protein